MAHLITDHYLMMVCTAPPRPKEKTMDDALHITERCIDPKKCAWRHLLFGPDFFRTKFPRDDFLLRRFYATDLRCR